MKSEFDIMKSWKISKENIQVSAICITYNQEEYIENCINSMLNQVTTFPFEIIIHDDASTDGTKKIIDNYAKNYPNIIRPLCEPQNLTKIDKSKIYSNLYNMAKGKYLAFCEGDDYFVNDNKLQIQYEAMGENKDSVFCVGNTIIHDLFNKRKDCLFNNYKIKKFLTDEDVFLGWEVHFSSYFIKKEVLCFPKEFYKYWLLDYVILTIGYSKGKIIYLPDIVSKYNYGVKSGVTQKIYNSDKEIVLKKEYDRIDYLENFNKYTNGKYSDVVNSAIIRQKQLMKMYEEDKIKVTPMIYNLYVNADY